jgi:hypothetical protein
MTWAVPKHEIADLLKLDVAARLQEAQEKVDLFERKYGQSFQAFEDTLRQDEEDFERAEEVEELDENRFARKQRPSFHVGLCRPRLFMPLIPWMKTGHPKLRIDEDWAHDSADR